MFLLSWQTHTHFFKLIVFETGSHVASSSRPQTPDSSAPTSQMLGLQVCITMSQSL